jgi:hypothetical protein
MTSTKDEHQGPGHGDVTLSLTSETKDGGQLHRSWVICECSARVLRGRLGPPQRETIASAEAVIASAEAVIATAEAVIATAEAVLNVPGAVHTGAGFDR